jgi:hypothetical protein
MISGGQGRLYPDSGSTHLRTVSKIASWNLSPDLGTDVTTTSQQLTIKQIIASPPSMK